MSKSNGTTTDDNAIEPSEDDPCVIDADGEKLDDKKNCNKVKKSRDKNNKGKNNRVVDTFVRFRSDVCERYKVTHQIFHWGLGLLGLLVLLVIVVIALGAAWPRIPHSQTYPVCSHPGCLRAASQIRGSMNASVSPCSDLWTWACGSWLHQNPLPKDRAIWNMRQQLEKQELTRTRDLISTLNLPLHVGSVEWKLKHLYESCLDVDNVNTDEARPLKNIISELGGWYILRDFSLDDFNANDLIKKLIINHGVASFFKITVESDPLTPGHNIIRISPSGLGLPDREYYYSEKYQKIQEAYKELIRDVVIHLSSPRDEAVMFGNNIFNFEKRIADITPTLAELRNPVDTSSNVIPIAGLQTIIPFYDILSELFPEADIQMSTNIIVTSEKYLNDLSRTISSTDHSAMNGYLMWTLVRHYLPFLSKKFTRVIDNFNTEFLGVKEPPSRWEMCASLAQDFMGLAINVLDERSSSQLTPRTSSMVNQTFHSILQTVSRRIKKFDKSMPQLHQHIKRKLANISLQVGLPANIGEGTYLKEYFNKLRIIKTNLFWNVIHGFEFRTKVQERRLTIKPSPDDEMIVTSEGRRDTVSYIPSQNLVFVPRGLLNYPFMEGEYPRSVIFARLGVDIAQALLSSILPYESFWGSNRKLLSQFHGAVNDSIKSVAKATSCLHNYSNASLEHSTHSETALETAKNILAISVAHEALSSLPSDEHIHQPGLQEFEDQALFFLAYAQTQCSVSTGQFQQFDSVVNFKLPQRSLLQVVWAHLAEFAESLDCSVVKKDRCPLVF